MPSHRCARWPSGEHVSGGGPCPAEPKAERTEWGSSLAPSFLRCAASPPMTTRKGRRKDPPGRPEHGFGHYLRDMMYGASDGVVTTLAVVAGASGAAFEPRVGLVLGLANLVADGLSMGVSNYLGLKSELQQEGQSVRKEQPWRHGAATLAAFVVAGAVPLLAYLPLRPARLSVLELALLLSALTLAAVGATRAPYVGRSRWRSALEVVSLAMAAAGAAWLVGHLARGLMNGA